MALSLFFNLLRYQQGFCIPAMQTTHPAHQMHGACPQKDTRDDNQGISPLRQVIAGIIALNDWLVKTLLQNRDSNQRQRQGKNRNQHHKINSSQDKLQEHIYYGKPGVLIPQKQLDPF